MMKRVLCTILALIMVLSLCACGSGEEAETTAATEVQETATATEATQSAETVDPNETPEEKVARLFDVARYEDEVYIDEFMHESLPNEMQAYGKTLTFGKSFDETMAVGLTVWYDHDANVGDSAFELHYEDIRCKDEEGRPLSVGFTGEPGEKIGDTGVLYAVSLDTYENEEAFSFAIGQTTEKSTLDELVETWGQPCGLGVYTDGYVELEYITTDRSASLEFVYDLNADRIIEVRLTNEG